MQSKNFILSFYAIASNSLRGPSISAVSLGFIYNDTIPSQISLKVIGYKQMKYKVKWKKINWKMSRLYFITIEASWNEIVDVYTKAIIC